MCNINVFKFFALTRTCMHLKVGLNRKRLGKTENLILTCGLLFLFGGILFLVKNFLNQFTQN